MFFFFIFYVYFIGGYIDGQGEYVPEGQSFVFMMTNVCTNEWPNLKWCGQQAPEYENQYGYKAHFNLEDGSGQLTSIGWGDKNPEVTWQFIDCDVAAERDDRTPNKARFRSCVCGK